MRNWGGNGAALTEVFFRFSRAACPVDDLLFDFGRISLSSNSKISSSVTGVGIEVERGCFLATFFEYGLEVIFEATLFRLCVGEFVEVLCLLMPGVWTFFPADVSHRLQKP